MLADLDTYQNHVPGMAKGPVLLLMLLQLINPSVYCLKLSVSPLDSSLPHRERLRNAISRSYLRARAITARIQHKNPAEIAAGSKLLSGEFPLTSHDGGYLMSLAVGTPPQHFANVIVDTGSDLNWIKCTSAANSSFFSANASATLKTIRCDTTTCESMDYYQCASDDSCIYEYDYASGGTLGRLFADTITLSSRKPRTGAYSVTQLPHVVLGCAIYSSQFSVDGILALGRGPLSLTSQLELEKFSYCLVPAEQGLNSSLYLGEDATLQNTRSVQHVSLVTQNKSSTYYFLELTGISVGETRLNITSEMIDAGGGTVIDSGTTLSFFPEQVYMQLTAAFAAMIPGSQAYDPYTGLSTCFLVPASYSFPWLELHFAGSASMRVPPANFVVATESGYKCLAIAPSPGIGIIGNMMQQNYQILYDLRLSRLSFSPTLCFALE